MQTGGVTLIDRLLEAGKCEKGTPVVGGGVREPGAVRRVIARLESGHLLIERDHLVKVECGESRVMKGGPSDRPAAKLAGHGRSLDVVVCRNRVRKRSQA